MNQKNINYLKDGLKYTGFGEKLNPELEQNIQQGLPEFVLRHQTEIGSSKMESTLHFKKSDQQDMYFFNSYNATLKHDSDPAQDRQQTFYMNRNAGVTAKEAFNLLEGRAVYKQQSTAEGEKYRAWQQLDLSQKDDRDNYKVKQFHDNYGYSLEKVLLDYPIKEMNRSVHQNMLIYSLEKGNLHAVTMERGGREEKMFIEANPQFKTINVYDSNMKKVEKETLLQQRTVGESVNSGVTGEVKQGAKQEQEKKGIQNNRSDDATNTAKAPKREKRKGLSA